MKEPTERRVYRRKCEEYYNGICLEYSGWIRGRLAFPMQCGIQCPRMDKYDEEHKPEFNFEIEP